MTIQEVVLVLGAGFAATVTMTIFMYGYATLTKQNTKVVHVLGNMMTAGAQYQSLDSQSACIGGIFHLGIGVLYNHVYYLLWTSDLISFTWLEGLVLGGASGILAIVVWWFYIRFHHHPPKLSYQHYFIALFFSHVVFALTATAIFNGFLTY